MNWLVKQIMSWRKLLWFSGQPIFFMVAETTVFFYQPRVVDPLDDLVFHPPTSMLPKITYNYIWNYNNNSIKLQNEK